MGNGLEEITKLGSPSALSLLASGGTTAIPALVIGGALLAVTAAVFTYSEFKKFEEKKHKKKIEQINQLYADRLKQIVVPFYGSIDGFPPIFQLTKENKYESLHYTLADIKDIGRLLPSGRDVALLSYQESIQAALRKLKAYYIIRTKNEDDDTDEITIRVLSYLLHMIDTKCLNFLGYEYDIAYLGAITEFITAYASLENEHSQHFDRLSDVYTNLIAAQHILKKHKEVLSLEETVSALRDHCVQHSDLLIRTLVEMVAHKDNTDLVVTVNHDELIDGILRKHYIRTAVLGHEFTADPQIDIPSSVSKEWIKNLSVYYLSSLNIDTNQINETIPVYEDFFSFIKRAEAYLANQTVAASEKEATKLNEEIKNQLKLIAKVFKNSGNFISTVYRLSDKEFHIVTDEAQLVERIKVMANFAKLIDDIISLQYLCIHFSKSIKQLGEIYVSNPLHFHNIFGAVDQLCTLIQQDLKTIADNFTELQEKNKDKMQLAKKELFPNEVRGLLDAVSVGIERLGSEVNRCRRKAESAISTVTVQSASYDMLKVAEKILERYFKKVELSTITPSRSVSEPNQKHNAIAIADKGQSINIVATKPGVSTEKNTITINVKKPQDESLAQLQSLTEAIYSKIIKNSETEKNKPENNFKLYDALIVMKEKSISLLSEDNKSEVRLKKAEKTLELTLTLAQKTSEFFNKTSDERKQTVVFFANEMHKLLNNEDNSDLIDLHYNSVSRYIYNHICNFGLFRTDTRKKLANFDAACSKLGSRDELIIHR